MITLSATLLAEQKKASTTPYVELKAREKIASVGRFRWTRYYTGAEAITRHAGGMAGDGSLLRARAVQNGAAYDLSYSRVTSPGSGSTYSSWSSIVADISETSGIAIATNSAKVDLVYVDWQKRAIYVKSSTDNGATFGAAVLADTAIADVTHVAFVYKDTTTQILFYAAAGIVYRVVRTSGTWGAAAAWTLTVSTVTGLAAHYYQDYNLLVTGTNAAGKSIVWQAIYGDGYSQSAGTWHALQELVVADAGSLVTYSHVSIGRPDVYRTIFLEAYSGTGSYTTPTTTHTLPSIDFLDALWHEPWPLNITCATGIALSNSATHAWLTTPNGVWRAEIAPADLNLTADLLKLTAYVDFDSGKLVATVRNDAGAYLSTASGKGDAWIGTELKLGLGYRTSAGNEAATHLSFWIDSYELTAEAGKAQLVLNASTPWELLQRWTATKQINYPAGSTTIVNILRDLMARAGIKTTLDNASSQLSTINPGFTIYPAFTIKPKETLKSAIQRLMLLVTDGIRFQNATAYVTDQTAADASAYAFGTTHPIKTARYKSGQPTSAPLPNQVQILAKGAFGQARDWDQIELRTATTTQELVTNLTTATQANTHAAGILRQSTIAAKDDTITTQPHCGLEVHDVVDVTEARAGLSAAKRRVKAIAITYDTQKPKFEQIITLGGV